MPGDGGERSWRTREFALPEPRNQRQVQVENILQPLDGGSRLVCQDLDQVWPRLVAGRLEGVIVKLLDAVLDAVLNLRPRQSAVDSRCRFCRVAAKESCTRASSQTKGHIRRQGPD